MKRILVCEDEDVIRDFVVINLKRAGYDVTDVNCGEEALRVFESEHGNFDVALLDIMMPGIDGFTVCKKLREKSSTLGIIMLSAKTQEMDKVSGLMIGADDYMTKPFAIEELLARVRVALKKHTDQVQQTHRLTVCGVTMDTDRHEVTCNGEAIELTNREYELVHVLMENKNIVMDREKLMNRVCGYDYIGETNIIDVYVRHIRSKIDDVYGIRFIQTVRGVGYVIKDE